MLCSRAIRLLRAATLAIAAALPGSARVHAAPQLPETELSWKNVSVDGKKVAVFCILRDSRGLMWMGTNNGLFFYDGASTHAMGRQELAGSQVHALAEMDGKLYVGSNNGLRIFDYATGTFSDAGKYPPREIRTLTPVDKELWIGGLNGIYVLDPSSDELRDVSGGLPHRSVYSILRDSRGIVYAGTYSGLARWNGRAGSFEPVEVHGGTEAMPRVFFANCLLEDSDHESIYVGTEGALYRYLPATDSWERITAVDRNNIKSMAHGDHGHILIGTDNGVFDLAGDSARHYRHNSRRELSLADNEIWCIFADGDHNVWAGHERGFSIAANSASIRTIKLSDLVNSGEGNDIYSIYRDSRDGLWLTGSNGAIHLAPDAAPQWYRHDGGPHPLSHNRIRDVHEDERGDMWFATDGGINRFNRELDRFDVFHVTDSAGEHNSNWVYAIVDDGDYYWLGGFLSGLQRVRKSRFAPGGATIAADRSLNSESPGTRLRNDLVNNVEKDREGKLWVLLFRDSLITRYDPATGSSTGFNIRALAGEYPNCMTQDAAGRICCAFSGGLIVIDTEGNHRTVRFPNTGSDESILAMGRVGNGVWVSTQSNVWSIDTNTGESTLLPIPQKSYTAIYEDPGRGKVYLGGSDEILEVDVASLAVDSDFKTIKIVLDDHDGRLDLSDLMSGSRGLTIPYGGSFTLVVGTLNYSPEAVQRYMYKLTGSDDDNDPEQGWIVLPEGANTITFSDLRMGHYNVLVKILGSDAPPAVIPLTVRPPGALSWWAICLYAMLAAGAVFWLVWYFRRKNTRAFREQERQAALENVERKLSFLSTISHDLKTPLSMILGPVSMLKERTSDPASRRSLETVYDNAVRLNNMIHRTLELQHLEDTGENLLIVSTLDVVEFCRGVFDVFKENNPSKNFVFHASMTPIYIEADAVKLESVITNLLSNACKYSDDGATISCGIVRKGDNVEIVVSDDGLGIAEIDQPLVFQRMFRAPSTSKMRDGTGLGLYLIKRYIELMGGTIELYSREGQGTAFVVELPAAADSACAKLPQEPARDPALARVLIVEDNQQIADFIADILGNKYTTQRADNGRTALSIAASFVPDIIVADEMMPVMTGLEMVKQMKQNPRLAAIPIIMLTAKTDNATENKSIKLGIDMFMAKPFEPHALLGRIEQLLKSRTEIKEKLRIQAIAEAEAKPIEAESVTEKALAKIARTIEENISDPDLNVNMLCAKSDIPNKQLYRLIKKYMGLSPLDYIRSVRLQKAAVLLSQNRFTVAEVSYMVGFKTPSYFAKCFQSQYGVKPSEYRSDDTTA
ncbi:MAG: response regulator [Muribaculaceae bacterium]|nr:response regulator [Muribaculaceae bacterium]